MRSLVQLVIAALLLLLPLAPSAMAQSGLPPAPYAYRQLDDPRQEAAARELMHELRCLVCQGQSIADSDAPMAGDMRSQVRMRIAAGESPDAVRKWLIARYGNWVTYDPPLGVDTLLLWATPLLVLAAGLWLALRRFAVGGAAREDERP